MASQCRQGNPECLSLPQQTSKSTTFLVTRRPDERTMITVFIRKELADEVSNL